MDRSILLLGGGGHCKAVLDSLLANNEYINIGIIDSKLNKEPIFGRTQYVGSDDDLERLYSEGYTDAFITIGSIGNTIIREQLYNKAKKIGFTIPNIIDRTTAMSRYVILGEGIFIGKNCVINTSVKIGNCAIINSAAIIEHDCVIGEFSHISPGAILCGGVNIGHRTHIGAGAVIKQCISVGNHSVVGIGSIVLKNIGEGILAYGNPCREVSEL